MICPQCGYDIGPIADHEHIHDDTLISVATLSRDLRDAATTMTADEARFLVDAYYTMQHDRIQASNQVRALGESAEPNTVLAWLSVQSSKLENQVKAALDRYSNAHELGKWARSQVGIGPVIAAGLLAHIDVTKPTAGDIWRFAGLDPTAIWEKGKKRPHNAALKTLCWKIGESFVKVSGNPNAFYGRAYVHRKAIETRNNLAGKFREQAEAGAKRVRKDTEAYKWYSGKQTGKPILPPGHVHARAKRWAVKLFLAHYHEVGFEGATGGKAPLPYPIKNIDGHSFKIPPGGSPEALQHLEEKAA